MLRSSETKRFNFMVKKKKEARLIQTWDVDVDNIVISKLIGMKNISKYLTGYSEVITAFLLVLPFKETFKKAIR